MTLSDVSEAVERAAKEIYMQRRAHEGRLKPAWEDAADGIKGTYRCYARGALKAALPSPDDHHASWCTVYPHDCNCGVI